MVFVKEVEFRAQVRAIGSPFICQIFQKTYAIHTYT
jgi:hypothetical protein